MRNLRVLCVIGLAACLAGCISSTTTVKVRPDGSGTIETTTTMSAMALAQLKQMMAGFGAKAGAQPEMFSEAQLRSQASRLGEGVSFVSSRPIKTADHEGVQAVYAFRDITRLRVSQTPSGPAGSESLGLPGTGASPGDLVSFGFARLPNGNAELSLLMPAAKSGDPGPARSAEKAQAPGAEQAQQLEMVQMLFKDLRIDLGIDVEGRIVKTNAPYVSGNHVTLLQMDFGELLSDPSRLQAMQTLTSLEDAKALLKGVKGFKVTLDRDVKIEFAPR